jgi:flagellar basal-body rod protein FlgC
MNCRRRTAPPENRPILIAIAGGSGETAAARYAAGHDVANFITLVASMSCPGGIGITAVSRKRPRRRPVDRVCRFCCQFANRIAQAKINRPGLARHGMNSISSIAVSGMAAASLRLQVSANNVANASSSGPLPGLDAAAGFPAAYAAERVNQVAAIGGGTSATVSTVSPGTVPAYDPSAPYADSHGMVATPNVDLASEIVQQLMARISFAANAQMIRADSTMMASLLDITA